MGGLSTLRGYPFKGFTGDRLVLFNGEVWTDPSRLALPHWPRGLKLGAFFDTGSAWSNRIPMNEGTLSNKSDFNTSLGLALDYEDLHVYFARPIDLPNPSWKVSARLSRPF